MEMDTIMHSKFTINGQQLRECMLMLVHACACTPTHTDKLYTKYGESLTSGKGSCPMSLWPKNTILATQKKRMS